MSSRRFPGRPRTNGIDAKVKTAISLDSDIAEKLDEEPNKSRLINLLLRKHYSMPETSRRLVYSLELMKQGSEERNGLSVLKIADMVNLEKAGILQDYFDGAKEPSFHFLETYAALFGIDRNWLKYGEKKPFASTEQIYPYATDYLDRIDELSPETIYFVRSQNKEGTSGIILKLSEFKFTYFPKTWNISSHVGGTGVNQIFEFYRLIEALKTQHNLVNPPYYYEGRSVNPEDFNNLFCGKIYPGAIVNLDENYWWDDFTDLARTYFNLRT